MSNVSNATAYVVSGMRQQCHRIKLLDRNIPSFVNLLQKEALANYLDEIAQSKFAMAWDPEQEQRQPMSGIQRQFSDRVSPDGAYLANQLVRAKSVQTQDIPSAARKSTKFYYFGSLDERVNALLHCVAEMVLEALSLPRRHVSEKELAQMLDAEIDPDPTYQKQVFTKLILSLHTERAAFPLDEIRQMLKDVDCQSIEFYFSDEIGQRALKRLEQKSDTHLQIQHFDLEFKLRQLDQAPEGQVPELAVPAIESFLKVYESEQDVALLKYHLNKAPEK